LDIFPVEEVVVEGDAQGEAVVEDDDVVDDNKLVLVDEEVTEEELEDADELAEVDEELAVIVAEEEANEVNSEEVVGVF
jgi:hypothetical protein